MRALVKRRVSRIAGLIALEVVLLALVNPANAPSVVLIVPFIALFFIIFLSALEVIGFLRGEDEKVAGLALRRPWLVAGMVAGVTLFMLFLQSIGQLTGRDVITMLVLFLVAYFYISRSSVSLFH
jgi:hypothetical protein